jgi:valyl-tRNA synthetase
LSEDKVRAMRNFANKIWNLGRYIQISSQGVDLPFDQPKNLKVSDETILKGLRRLIQKTTEALDDYRLNEAAELIYSFSWHTFADQYIEETKERAKNKDLAVIYTLRHVYLNILKLLHPFMPFVTEAVWQEVKNLRNYPKQLLITSHWPEV